MNLNNTEKKILNVLKEGEDYGVGIARKLNKDLTFYTDLYSLESKGLIQSRWGEERDLENRGGARKKYYSLTEAGKSYFSE